MSLRNFTQSFRSATIGGQLENFSDTIRFTNVSSQSVRSPGATQLDVLQLLPTQGERWAIQSVSVQAQLAYLTADQTFGKFGKLIMGLVPSGAESIQSSFTLANPPVFLPLPKDSSMTAVMWDPAVDQMPPVGDFSNIPQPTNLLPVFGQVAVPIIRPLESGDNMGIGMWLTPSLIGSRLASIGSAGLQVYNAQYTVVYDDQN